jgi:hypothetical protein
VKLYCDPPMIFPANEPVNKVVAAGTRAQLQVMPAGNGPFNYQWYVGASGSTLVPLPGNEPTLTTPPIFGAAEFWVRVSNACGSVDSGTARVTTVGANGKAVVKSRR